VQPPQVGLGENNPEHVGAGYLAELDISPVGANSAT
jgi:hypothetical protein